MKSVGLKPFSNIYDIHSHPVVYGRNKMQKAKIQTATVAPNAHMCAPPVIPSTPLCLHTFFTRWELVCSGKQRCPF